jgi:hypothetical protein
MAYNNYIDEGFAIQLNYDGQLRIGAWMTLAPGYHHMINMRQLERRTILKSNSFASTFQQFLSLSISTVSLFVDNKHQIIFSLRVHSIVNLYIYKISHTLAICVSLNVLSKNLLTIADAYRTLTMVFIQCVKQKKYTSAQR